MMKSEYSCVVIGAGPAGMSAALTLAESGVDVLMLDEQHHPGGQIYRNVGSSEYGEYMGQDYLHGKTLIDALATSKVEHSPSTSIWSLSSNGEIGLIKDNRSQTISAQRIVLCTGAQERPMPFPGWELPGVMTAGGGQILMKSAGLVPDEAVLAGSGPLLLLLAWQFLNAGVAIKGIVDTTPGKNMVGAIPMLPKALGAAEYLWKGTKFLHAIKKAGVPIYRQAINLHAHGQGKIENIRFVSNKGPAEINVSHLFIHNGVIPQTQLAELGGCKLSWNQLQHCWNVDNDKWGRTTNGAIFIAGDGGAIGGAKVAALQGKLAAIKVMNDIQRISAEDVNKLSKLLFSKLKKELRIRPFLELLYQPSQNLNALPDHSMVCRCEEITAGEVRSIARLGCQGPNQMKSFSRCGMGPCQGRQCELTVATLIADVQRRTIEDVGKYRTRPPIRPLTLGQLGNEPGT